LVVGILFFYYLVLVTITGNIDNYSYKFCQSNNNQLLKSYNMQWFTFNCAFIISDLSLFSYSFSFS